MAGEKLGVACVEDLRSWGAGEERDGWDWHFSLH